MTKTKNSKSRRTTKAKTVVRKPKKLSSGPNQLQIAHKICEITNPFCTAAKGSRWPDNNAAPTIPITMEGVVNLTADSNGNSAILFGVNPLSGIYSASTINNTTGEVSFGGRLPYAGATDWVDHASEWRLVSGGVEVYSIASMMSSQGVMRTFQIGSNATSVALESANIFSYAYPKVVQKPLKESGSIYGLFMPGGPESRNFSLYEGDFSSEDWSNILVSVVGAAASTTVAQIHYIMHYEIKFLPNQIMNRLARPPPGANTMLQNISTRVTSTVGGLLEGHRQQIEETLKAQALNYLKQGVHAGLTARLGPLGEGLAAITDTAFSAVM